MKFPLLANAFGHQKLILEIGGNAIGVSDPTYQPQLHRRRPEKSAATAAADELRAQARAQFQRRNQSSGMAGTCQA